MKWENANCEIERFTRALVLNGFRCGKNGAPGRDLTGRTCGAAHAASEVKGSMIAVNRTLLPENCSHLSVTTDNTRDGENVALCCLL